MARLVHLSDLHFGAHDDTIVAAVLAEVDAAAPDLVIISGDFTQRAKTEQYQEAAEHVVERHIVVARHRQHLVPRIA
jgi:3',5'-cyclic AMP phosphodiesterase CpdA